MNSMKKGLVKSRIFWSLPLVYTKIQVCFVWVWCVCVWLLPKNIPSPHAELHTSSSFQFQCFGISDFVKVWSLGQLVQRVHVCMSSSHLNKCNSKLNAIQNKSFRVASSPPEYQYWQLCRQTLENHQHPWICENHKLTSIPKHRPL